VQIEGSTTRAYYLSISNIRWINSSPSQSASLLSILLLSVYLSETLPSISFILCPFFLFTHSCHIPQLSHINWFEPPPPDNKLWAVEFMKRLLMQISPAFCYFLFNANTFPITLYLNNLNVISSLNMSDHVLHMYKSGKLSGIEQYLWDNNVTGI
jgi:hypothetical protein